MFPIPRRCESPDRKNELATIPENGAVCSYLEITVTGGSYFGIVLRGVFCEWLKAGV
jgi:hypothetical protein